MYSEQIDLLRRELPVFGFAAEPSNGLFAGGLSEYRPLPNYHRQIPEDGWSAEKQRSCGRCRMARSLSRKPAVAISSRKKNFCLGSAHSRLMGFAVCSLPVAKGAETLHSVASASEPLTSVGSAALPTAARRPCALRWTWSLSTTSSLSPFAPQLLLSSPVAEANEMQSTFSAAARVTGGRQGKWAWKARRCAKSELG